MVQLAEKRIPSRTPFDGERIWRSVLGQMRLEVDKTTFETWIQDTVFLSYSPETGIVRIGAPNGHVCAWLNDRLLGLTKKLLIGASGLPLDVQFEIRESSPVSESSGPAVMEKVRGTDGRMRFDTLYDSITNEVLKPDTILTIPQYLWRLSPLLGPTSTCRYIGIRQIQYFRGLMDCEGVFHATVRELADFSGMGATCWTQGPRAETESWLFRCDTQGVNYVRGQGGKIFRTIPKRYFVCGTLPLSPADQRHVWELLKSRGVLRDPVSALRQVAQQADEASRFSLLAPGDQLVVSGPHPPSQTIEQMVVASCNIQEKDADLIRSLSHDLQRRITGGWDAVPQYFVRRVGPKIEYPAMLLALWLHHRASHKTLTEQEEHPESNLVFVPGGFREIGARLGLKPETVRDWFNAKHHNKLLERYVQIDRQIKQSDRHVSVLFRISLSDRDCPLLSEDESMVNRRFRDSLLEASRSS
jgi:hypothetical protein